MAIQVPIVSEFVDTGVKGAMKAFSDFRTSIAEAQGGMNKFKAGSKVALDFVAKNAVSFGATAAAAIGKFVFNGAMQFQELALASGKLADATGLTVEQASRLKEVAGDIGIESGTIESSIGKMNKVLGTSPELFKELGVEIGYTAGGARDANQTFLNVVDRLNSIEDPAERARVASQLLGKGWQGMSELIAQGSDKLSKSLDSVSEQKVISEAELRKARNYRESMDKLSDATTDLAQSLGENLIPMLAKAAELAATGVDIFNKLGMGMGQMGNLSDQLTSMVKSQNDAWTDGYRAMINAYEANEQLTSGLEDTYDATSELNLAWQRLLGNLDRDAMFRDAIEQVTNLEEAAAAAFGDPTKYNAFRDEMDRTYQTVAELLQTVQTTNAEQNQIKLMVDTGQVERAIKLLQIMNLRPGTTLGQATQHMMESQAFLNALVGPVSRRAMGGTVSAGGTYLVGERGPELLTVGAGGGHVSPMTGGGSTINVTVTSADPNEVVRALQQYVRQSGPVPVNIRTM